MQSAHHRRPKGRLDAWRCRASYYDFFFGQRVDSFFDQRAGRQARGAATPPVLIAFDVLHHRSHDVTSKPLSYRRLLLEDTIAGSSFVLPALRLEPYGLTAAWDQVKRNSWEGLVAKDESSTYREAPPDRG